MKRHTVSIEEMRLAMSELRFTLAASTREGKNLVFYHGDPFRFVVFSKSDKAKFFLNLSDAVEEYNSK